MPIIKHVDKDNLVKTLNISLSDDGKTEFNVVNTDRHKFKEREQEILIDAVFKYSSRYNEFAELLVKANEGDGEAQVKVAKEYFAGDGCIQDDYESLYWMKKAVENNNPEANMQLGSWYFLGQFVDQSEELGIMHLKRAVKQNYLPAKYRLALYYLQKANYNEYFELLFEAAQEGYYESQRELGLLFLNKINDYYLKECFLNYVKENVILNEEDIKSYFCKEGENWLSLAATHGCAVSCLSLGEFYLNLRSYDKAQKFLENALVEGIFKEPKTAVLEKKLYIITSLREIYERDTQKKIELENLEKIFSDFFKKYNLSSKQIKRVMNGSIALKLNDCIVNLSEIFVCSIMAKEHEEVAIYLAILYALFRKDNLSLAMEMFQKWTYLESSSCQCNLGKCWEIKKEENLAKDFYDKAAEQNNPIAMFGLFKFLHKPNSYLTIKELGLLQKSASCNYKMALLQLSQEYFNGNIRGNENNLLVATVISNYAERLHSKYGVDISGIDDSYHFDGIEKFVLINSYSNRSY